MRDYIMRKAWIMGAMKSCLAAMMFCVAIAPASSSAAVNLIENGDFEMDATGAVSAPLNYVYANNGNKQGQPQGWTLSPTSRFGLVNEGTDRHAVSDLLGAHALFFERRRNENMPLEAMQTFTVPAPGKYMRGSISPSGSTIPPVRSTYASAVASVMSNMSFEPAASISTGGR